MPKKVYSETILITRDYLGPAAERFIDRQISYHLNKEPRDLEPKDIPALAEWVKISIGILTEDKKTVEEFAKRILKLKS